MAGKVKTKEKVPKNKLSCSVQVMNFSNIERTSRFDKPTFNPEKLLESLPQVSPKMISLLKNIQELDKRDYQRDQKLYKHMIYSGVSGGFGSKMIASCMIASGYLLVNKPVGSKIGLDQSIIKTEDEAKLALLSSTAIWNNSTGPTFTKETLAVFNKRPENTHGDSIRFIILDSGFTEGVDLFDVKYVHMFEEQLTDSAFIQARGRSLRFKGQCGLHFKENTGWEVQVFNYILYRPLPRRPFEFTAGKESIIEFLKKENKELEYKQNLEKNLTKLLQEGSVDYYLNKEINEYTKESKVYSIIKNLAIGVGALGIGGGLAYILQRNRIKKENEKVVDSFQKRLGKMNVYANLKSKFGFGN